MNHTPEPWAPRVCPITGRKLFMWIEHHKTHEMVPTYGGPYDSYTIPVKYSDGSYICERYDHDLGGWITDSYEDVGVQIVDDQLYTSNDDPEELKLQINEYRNAITAMSRMLKNREWANLLSTNDAIAELDAQITLLTDEYNQERRDSLDCSDIEKLKFALSWMGVSTPSSIEECGAKQKHLIRDLITAVLRHKLLKTEAESV